MSLTSFVRVFFTSKRCYFSQHCDSGRRCRCTPCHTHFYDVIYMWPFFFLSDAFSGTDPHSPDYMWTKLTWNGKLIQFLSRKCVEERHKSLVRCEKRQLWGSKSGLNCAETSATLNLSNMRGKIKKVKRSELSSEVI